eukprot:361092-Chlamydomonas_euryale.AAC.1
MPGLTVAECLHYAAACRLPGGRGAAGPREAHARVARVLRELDLEHLAGTHAASGAVISGGERKRVCIGMELVGDARLLLLDEPTSGLVRVHTCSRRRAGGATGGRGGGLGTEKPMRQCCVRPGGCRRRMGVVVGLCTPVCRCSGEW